MASEHRLADECGFARSHFSYKPDPTDRRQPRIRRHLQPIPRPHISSMSSGAFQSATVARRGRASSRKRLLLGFCSWLVPRRALHARRSSQNPAGTSRRAPCLRRALEVAEMHLQKSSTEKAAVTGGLQSFMALRNLRSRSPNERQRSPGCILLPAIRRAMTDGRELRRAKRSRVGKTSEHR
jgi:hypothetical protein